jgi:hypothetical protein
LKDKWRNIEEKRDRDRLKAEEKKERERLRARRRKDEK